MAKKAVKKEAETIDPLFVLGLDESGKPRGARFAELKDKTVSAAMDLNCRVLIDQPDTVSEIAMKLPVGRIYASGKAFIPNIRRDLYDKISEAACGFRGLRPWIPIERDHAVRSKAATRSDEGGRGVVADMRTGVRF